MGRLYLLHCLPRRGLGEWQLEEAV